MKKIATMGKQEKQITIARREIEKQVQAYLDKGGEIEVIESTTDVNYRQEIVTRDY